MVGSDKVMNQLSPPTRNAMVAIDLFAGPGGLSLGFRMAGFSVAAAVECDQYAGMTYEKNFPESVLFKSKIQNVDPDKLLDVLSKRSYQKVILIGGPPCQPFSFANRKTNGNENPEASAVDYYVKFVERIRPDAFLFENVVSFRCMDKGKSMESFRRRLEEIGFDIDVAIIDFDEFGIPQRRRRLFIGGLRKDYSVEFRLCPKARNKPKPTVRDAVSDLPPLDDGGGGKDEMDYSTKKKLTAFQEKARADADRLYNHWCSKNSKAVVETIRCIEKGSSLKKSWNILPEHVKARYKNPEAIHSNIYRRLCWSEQSPTIVHARRAMLLHPSVNRIISVREAARIQGFPDSFRFYGGIHSQYQQVANAVSPVLGEVLAKVFLRHLRKREVATNQ